MTPQVLIHPRALARLQLYIALCPTEIGGLGHVEEVGDQLVIRDCFILRQKTSVSTTELDVEAIFAFMLEAVDAGSDLATVRLWWHSHADAELCWSDTDRSCIEGWPGPYLVSVVGNRLGEFRCRLDRFEPKRETWDNLPLVPLPGDGAIDLQALRSSVEAEVREQVRAQVILHHLVPVEGLAEVVHEYPIDLNPDAGGN